MRYFTDSILLLLYSTLTFFYVPADQALVFALLFAVILCCITYLCKVCKTESCSHNSLPVLKPAGNIIPVLAGSYVIFGLCSLWFSDLLLFFPLLLYQTLSAGLFPLAVAELPLWGFLVFQINRFPAVLCLLGIFGFILSFFLWLYAGKYHIHVSGRRRPCLHRYGGDCSRRYEKRKHHGYIRKQRNIRYDGRSDGAHVAARSGHPDISLRT